MTTAALVVNYATVDEVFTVHSGEEFTEYLAEYLKPFASPIFKDEKKEEFLCLKCGKSLNQFMLGTFQWGLAHGEGFCGKCKWPARLYHYLKLPDGTEGKITLMLQYHPDGVSKKIGGNWDGRKEAI